MDDQEAHDRAGTLSVEDMQKWLGSEIRNSAKAHELRVKEATDLVTAYAAGKLSPEEASDRLYRYDRRWGEALFGANAAPGISDEAILQRIDKARDEAFGAYARRTQNAGKSDGPVR